MSKPESRPNLIITQALFASLAVLLGTFALLTAAGVPNGLLRGSPIWWAIVALFLVDGLLMGLVSWGLGTSRRGTFFAAGSILLAGNLILTAIDQIGWIDLVFLAIVLLTGVFLVRIRKDVFYQKG